MSFEVERHGALPDLLVITPKVFVDERGDFFETWHQQKLKEFGLSGPFVQDNQSVSVRGVVRGLHYQLPPSAQGKLVRVVAGDVFDVAVDVRRSSTVFGGWGSHRLAAESHEMLWIPPGFAHGFMALSETATVLYKATAPYSPEDERTLYWNDPQIGIDWPDLGDPPLLSSKDSQAPMLVDVDAFP